jgi:hypothetical protein
MFLRFATKQIDEDSRKPRGVFIAAHTLLDSGDLSSDEWQQIRDILIWFNKNLPTPPDSFKTSRAIFWFKSSAEESIRRIWELVQLLRHHGHHVEVYKCRKLGNVCYQDELQVASYPSKSDGRITVQ